MSVLDENVAIFKYFEEISKIPHGSFHEEKIADYVENFEYIKLDRDKSTFKSHRDFNSEKEISFKHF